jgi:hypothetical protein
MGGNVDLGFQDGPQVRRSHFWDVVRSGASLALHQGHNSFLWGGIAIGAISRFAANEGLISLDELAFAAERADAAHARIGHCFTDAMRQKPCGLQGDTKDSAQLVGAHTFFGRAEQVHCLQPYVQLDMAGFEDGADLDGERLAAGIALIDADSGAIAFQWPALIDYAAMRTDTTVRPQPRLDEPISGFFAVEMSGGKNGRHDVSP